MADLVDLFVLERASKLMQLAELFTCCSLTKRQGAARSMLK